MLFPLNPPSRPPLFAPRLHASPNRRLPVDLDIPSSLPDSDDVARQDVLYTHSIPHREVTRHAMRLGHDIEEELDRFEQEQEEKHDGERTQDGNPFRLTRPPSPPAKEPSIKLPPPLKFDHSRTPSDSPSEPPNRPLPARPPPKFTLIPRPSTGASDASTTRPPPTRPPPLRPQMPLGMNPPTRPGTAASSGKEIKLPPVMFMSEKRGSYGSSGSTTGGRILKYGRGKFSHVELVPQPSNDLEDPLVSPPPPTPRAPYVNLTRDRTGPGGERNSTFGLSSSW